MPLSDYLVGLGFFTVVVGASLAAAVLIVRRRVPELDGAAAAAAVGTLATATLLVAHLLPGIVGVLGRSSVALTALALALLAWRVAPAEPGAALPLPRPPPSGTTSRILAAVGVAVLAVWVGAEVWQASAAPTRDIDSLTSHLPKIARWIQSGSFWQIDQFVPLLSASTYPHNGDVVLLAAVLPWENDAFVRPIGFVYLALAGLSAYALAVELRAPRATAALFGSAFASLPSVLVAAGEGAKTDAILLAAFAAGVLFLVRHRRTALRADLVLAGVALGLAFGTKWYGVSSVAVVLAVWAVGRLAAGDAWRVLARDGALLVTAVGAFGGFWLVRNAVEAGNPFFPVDLGVLGVQVLDGTRDFIRECAGFTIAHYLDSPDIVRDLIVPALWDRLAVGGAAIGVGVVLAVVIASRRGRRLSGELGLVLAVAAAAVLLAAAYVVTPDSAFGPEGQPLYVEQNVRYLLPALAVAAPVGAWAVGALGWLRPLAETLVLAAITTGAARGLEASATNAVKVGLAAVLLSGAAYLAMRSAQGLSRRGRWAFRAVAAGLTLALLGAVGYARQERFNDGRYESYDPVIDVLIARAAEGEPVALAGVWDTHGLSPVLPAFGDRLRNRVAYLGHFVDGLLREYEERDRWSRAIRDGDYALLLVGRGGYAEACPVPGERSDDDAWARAETFDVLARSSRFTLYRVD